MSSTSENPIRVGFVGLSTTGWAASALGPAILSSPYYKLTAVSTTNPTSASATAEKYSLELGYRVKAYHGSTAEIASDPDVDMVIVSVRSPAHWEAVIPVIEAGKNVFVEWPAGVSLKETQELADRAREKGVRTIVGLQDRLSPAANKAKELVESGKIGKVLSTSILSLAPGFLHFYGPKVSERNAYTIDETKGAGVLEIGVGHQMSALTYILGDFASVSATSAIMYPQAESIDESGSKVGTLTATAPDHIAFTGMLKSGAIANVMWRGGQEQTPGRKSLSWVIDGELGSICLEGEYSFINNFEPKLTLNGELVEVEKTDMVIGNARAALEDFAKGDKGRGLYVTLDDAVKNRKILDAIDRSAKEGRRIEL